MCFGDTVGATYFYAADFAFSYQSIPRFRADIKYLAHLSDMIANMALIACKGAWTQVSLAVVFYPFLQILFDGLLAL